MVKHMFRSDKRGISVIIGYILLISIAIGLSVMVYNWLLNYLPGETAECPDSVHLDLRSLSCQGIHRQLNFTVRNNGHHTFDGFIVKVNDRPDARMGVFTIDDFFERLSPGQDIRVEIDYSAHVAAEGGIGGISSQLTLLEVQPFIIHEDGSKLICQPGVSVRLSC